MNDPNPPNMTSLTQRSSYKYSLIWKGELVARNLYEIYTLYDSYGNIFLGIVPSPDTVIQRFVLKKVQPGLRNYNEILNAYYRTEGIETGTSSSSLKYGSIALIDTGCFKNITSSQPLIINLQEIDHIRPFAFENFHGDIVLNDSDLVLPPNIAPFLSYAELIFYNATGILYVPFIIYVKAMEYNLIEMKNGENYLKQTHMKIKNIYEFGEIEEISFTTRDFIPMSVNTESTSTVHGTVRTGDVTSISKTPSHTYVSYSIGDMASGLKPLLSQRILLTEESRVRYQEQLLPITEIHIRTEVFSTFIPYIPSTVTAIEGFSKYIGVVDISHCTITSENVHTFFSSILDQETQKYMPNCFGSAYGTLIVTPEQYTVLGEAGYIKIHQEIQRAYFIGSIDVRFQSSDGTDLPIPDQDQTGK